MTISVTDTATGQELTVREVSAALAVPAGGHVSAPYSRAVGILEGWARDERHAVDEFAAWIEGQAAQAAAEMRALCDELELPVAWAVLPDVQPASLIAAEVLFDKNNPHDRIGRGMGPALRARYGTVGGHSPFDTTPAPDENMPGRIARITPRDNPLAQAYAEREARGWTPDPAECGPHEQIAGQLIVKRNVTADEAAEIKRRWRELHGKEVDVEIEPDHGPLDRWLRRTDERLRAWWRAKQTERDERMGVGE